MSEVQDCFEFFCDSDVNGSMATWIISSNEISIHYYFNDKSIGLFERLEKINMIAVNFGLLKLL